MRRTLLLAMMLAGCEQSPSTHSQAVGQKPSPNAATACRLSLTAPATFLHDYSSAVSTDICSYTVQSVAARTAFFQTYNTTPPGTGLNHSITVTLGPGAAVGVPMTLQGKNNVDAANANIRYTEGVVERQCSVWTGTVTLVSDAPSFDVTVDLTCVETWGFANGLRLTGELTGSF